MQNRSLKILFLTMFLIFGSYIQSSQCQMLDVMESSGSYTFETLVATPNFTAFYLWAPDTSGNALVDIDFTTINQGQLLTALKTALLNEDVYLNFVITPPTKSATGSVTMQGYDSAGNAISGLSYQATQGAAGQVLGLGYIRYSYTPNPEANDLIDFPAGPDFTVQQLSNLWIKISQVDTTSVRRVLELARAVYKQESLTQNVYIRSIEGLKPSEVWLSVSFDTKKKSDHHVIVNNKNSGKPTTGSLANETNEYQTSTMSYLQNLKQSDLKAGIIFSIVPYGGNVYLCVQAATTGHAVLGWVQFEGLTTTTLKDRYIITGSFIETAIPIYTGMSFMLTSSTDTGSPATITIPNPSSWPGFSSQS